MLLDPQKNVFMHACIYLAIFYVKREFVFVTSSMSSSPLQKSREWRPLEQRTCTDIPWLLLFILFNVGMVGNTIHI